MKDPKAGVGFKSYKNESWTERVFVIKKVTKKAVPPKFYVNGRWHTQDALLKSAPRDQKSIASIAKRDREQKEEDARVRAVAYGRVRWSRGLVANGGLVR